MDNRNSYSEHELLLKIAEGDEWAFNEVFRLYHKRFYAAVLKLTHSSAIAEEMVQDVFVTLWIKRAALSQLEKPFSYLFTILYNSVYKYLKEQAISKRKLAEIAAQTIQEEDILEDLLVAKEQQAILNRAINQLPDQQKRVYQLIKQQGLSREAAAQELGISPNTVRNHLSGAIKYLQAYLKRALPLLFYLFITKS